MALMHAAAAGNTDIVGWLPAKGAAVNMRDDVAGVSALQLAIFKINPHCVCVEPHGFRLRISHQRDHSGIS
jgi:hypothetical protein